MADLGQASSPLLEAASLRLPDAADYEVSDRRRSDGSHLAASSDTSRGLAGRAHHFYRLADMLANASEERAAASFLFFGTPDNLSLSRPINGTAGWGGDGDNATFSIDDYVYRHSFTLMTLYSVAYLVVFAIGVVGNCFVIAVVYRSPRMRTVTNYFIVNLAFADILVIVFCLPATLVANVYVPWVLGWWMCKTVPYVQGVSVTASVYSLVAVSLDRFLAIWWPLKCQITKRRARFIIVVIWSIALTATLPWALFFDLVPIFGDAPDVMLCVEVWPKYLDGDLYFLIGNCLFCYILPMILISICYILIWIKVWRRDIPTDTKDAQMERMQQKSRVKVVKMLVAVVVLFVLSWLPLYIIFARIKFGGRTTREEEDLLQVVAPMAQWLGSANSCINPVLYAFFNLKYRRGFVAILKSRRCCGRLRYYESVMMSSSASLRKSSYYVNNNNSTRRAPPGHDTSVSYIYNNTGV